MREMMFQQLVYIASNAFRIYILYKFIHIFFKQCNVSGVQQFLAFAGYFAMNSLVFLLFDIPILNLITNLGLLFFLTCLYQGKWLLRLLATVLIYVMNMLLEGVTLWCVLPRMEYYTALVLTNVVTDLLLFLLVLIVERLDWKKHHCDISLLHWFAVFFIPLCSIVLAGTIIVAPIHWLLAIADIICLFAINILVFYLYDFLSTYYVAENEKNLLQQQNAAYLNQFELISKSQNHLRMLRHDIKNHIFRIQDLVKKGKIHEVSDYLQEIILYTQVDHQYVSSGNDSVDSILNYKIQEAIQEHAKVNTQVHIPEQLEIAPFYLNVILGNLLDNAIEAIKTSEKKQIGINIELDRGILYISVKNTHGNGLKIENNTFQTTKKNPQYHGYGLHNVKTVVEKYQGTLEIDYDEQIFSVDILLYNT